jgi:hypothetical protein
MVARMPHQLARAAVANLGALGHDDPAFRRMTTQRSGRMTTHRSGQATQPVEGYGDTIG